VAETVVSTQRPIKASLIVSQKPTTNRTATARVNSHRNKLCLPGRNQPTLRRKAGMTATTLGLGFRSDGAFNALRAVGGLGVYGHIRRIRHPKVRLALFALSGTR